MTGLHISFPTRRSLDLDDGRPCTRAIIRDGGWYLSSGCWSCPVEPPGHLTVLREAAGRFPVFRLDLEGVESPPKGYSGDRRLHAVSKDRLWWTTRAYVTRGSWHSWRHYRQRPLSGSMHGDCVGYQCPYNHMCRQLTLALREEGQTVLNE